MGIPEMVAAATGAPADCEARGSGWLGQDVNAWSSLGYVAVGTMGVVAVLRRGLPRVMLVFAALLVVEGGGSWLYHGRGGDAAQLLHDVPLVAALGFVAGWQVGRLVGGVTPWSLGGAAAGAAAGAATALAGLTNIPVGILAATIAVTEVVARRRRLAAIWTAPLLGGLAVAVATWLMGTSGSPVCDEQSWLQPHGAWHGLSALVLLGWLDAALAVQDPRTAPRFFRRTVDRVIGLSAVGIAHGFYRTIDVIGRDRLTGDRPVLLVANHGNGFVDPVVVAGVLRRLPRFIAKAALWKVVVARPMLGLAGVLPIHRSSDGDRPGDNVSVFAACHGELARRATVAIFPEGTTGDRPSLDRVKAGAARIALGALPEAPGLEIVPVGLAFESRIETRGPALVVIGTPIPVDGRLTRPLVGGEADPVDVRALTADITAALAAVSPQFATIEEREVLRAAAKVALARVQGSGRPPRFGQVELLARRLAARPDDERVAIVEAYRRSATSLQFIGLGDWPVAGRTLSGWRLAGSMGAIALVGPAVVTATLIHLPALTLVVVVTGWVRSTATKGTVRLLVGLVTMLLTWTIAGMVLGDGWGAVVAGCTVALSGALAFAVLTPLTRATLRVWGWLRARDRVGLLGPVAVDRVALVDLVAP